MTLQVVRNIVYKSRRREHHYGESDLLLVKAQGLVDVFAVAQDDGAALVDVGGLQHGHVANLSLEHARACLAACLLDEERHGEALIQDAQLAIRRLAVGRVEEDTAVEDRSVHIGHHGAHVALREGLRLRVLEARHRSHHLLVPERAVSLVHAVDSLGLVRDAHLSARVHELAEARIQREAVDAAVGEGAHELRGGTIHAVARAHDVRALLQDVDLRRHGVHGRLALPHREDGAGRHVAVDVGRAIQRVKGHDEATRALRGDDHWLLVLLRDERTDLAAAQQGVDHHLVAEQVQLLHIVAAAVVGPGQAVEARNSSLAHSPVEVLSVIALSLGSSAEPFPSAAWEPLRPSHPSKGYRGERLLQLLQPKGLQS
eukprot:scaffold1307_cov200-Pinguiococcus_pyrenoidosus.AAC.4